MFKIQTAVVVAGTMTLAACASDGPVIRDQPAFQLNKSTPAAVLGVSQDQMFEATQNWTAEIREKYWHHNQGSLMAPFDIATNIERHDSETELFFSDTSISRYRYVPQNKGKHNKYGLPLGFTYGKYDKQDGAGEQAYVGMTCSACHSTVITHKGKGLMLDGAPSQGNFQAMFLDLTLAFRETLVNEAKLERLAQRMGQDTAIQRSAMRKRLTEATETMEARREMNRTDSVYGYGRVDAIGQIFNAVAAQNLGIEKNRKDPNAPVNYPHVWGTHQSNLVQWNAFAPNVTKFDNIRILGPLVRNAGEVIGVFGYVDVLKPGEYDASDPRASTYRNSIKQDNLIEIEQWLEQLAPPPWPEQIFGPLDPAKVARGKEVYNDKRNAKCATCHEVLESPFHCYNAKVLPVWSKNLQTDPGQAFNARASAKVGRLAGRTIRRSEDPSEKNNGNFPDDPNGEESILQMLVHQVIRSVVRDIRERPLSSAAGFLGSVIAERREDRCDVPFENAELFKNPDPDQTRKMDGAYKARPLNGIWATAPFLHNGSVPSLRALLDKPADRPAMFTLGGWEYDPANVGYAPYDGPHGFVFDASKKGNSNGGHLWGTDLSDADKEALVEYMKQL